MLLLALLPGCASLRRPAPAVDTAHDERIRQEVEARLAAEPVLQPGPLRVAVRGGTVSLYGSVRGMGALHCALTTAELVEGVRSVVDRLEMVPGPREARCLAPRVT